MYKFFIDASAVRQDTVTLEGENFNHMSNVLRLKPGDTVKIGDRDGMEYLCTIDGFTEGEAHLKVLEAYENLSELPVEIHLYQGLPKKDKMELIIQKSVELGVASVTPVAMKNCVVKLDAKAKVKKTERWQKIADAAAKQAKRGIQPKVHAPRALNALMDELGSYDRLLIPYENAAGMTYTREVLSEVKNCGRIGVVIGPEGGFDNSEIEMLKQTGAKVITLGKRILRTETAGLAVLSYLMIDMED